MSVWCNFERLDVIAVLTQVVGSIYVGLFLALQGVSSNGVAAGQASAKKSLDDAINPPGVNGPHDCVAVNGAAEFPQPEGHPLLQEYVRAA